MTQRISTVLLLFILSFVTLAQQSADSSFDLDIPEPSFEKGTGPVIAIDEAHNNFHTLQGRYSVFADLLERDGYILRSNTKPFTKDGLEKFDVLVISNALNDVNTDGNWHLPTPSAFNDDELKAIVDWVNEGGRLFLIADHMPFAGAAADLAHEFGFQFTNGFVFDNDEGNVAVFKKDSGLQSNALTSSPNAVEQVATFTGQAFRIPQQAHSILQLNEQHLNYLPDTAWVFNENTPRLPVKGWSQLAYTEHGSGRVVVSGEAAMFTAQVSGSEKRKFGMNNPQAKDNSKLLLNLIGWLSAE